MSGRRAVRVADAARGARRVEARRICRQADVESVFTRIRSLTPITRHLSRRAALAGDRICVGIGHCRRTGASGSTAAGGAGTATSPSSHDRPLRPDRPLHARRLRRPGGPARPRGLDDPMVVQAARSRAGTSSRLSDRPHSPPATGAFARNRCIFTPIERFTPVAF